MNPAGALFDVMKLRDVSKDVVSRMSADTVYREVLAWAGEFDSDLPSAWRPSRSSPGRRLPLGAAAKAA